MSIGVAVELAEPDQAAYPLWVQAKHCSGDRLRHRFRGRVADASRDSLTKRRSPPLGVWLTTSREQDAREVDRRLCALVVVGAEQCQSQRPSSASTPRPFDRRR